MKTFTATPETVTRDWFVVDADGKTLGRIATEIALRLRGKHKPEYTPHVDTGDYSGFPGGIKQISFEKLQAHKPEMIIEKAVKGMLPKGPLGRAMFRKLKVYAGAEHNHAAQQPQVLDI